MNDVEHQREYGRGLTQMRCSSWLPVVAAFLSAVLSPLARTSADDLRIPIHLHKPDTVEAETWPVTVGVPFVRGACPDLSMLTVVDDKGKAQPAEFVAAGVWDDGSVRWAHVTFQPRFSRKYFVIEGKRPKAQDVIHLEQTDDTISLTTGGVTYQFRSGESCFESIAAKRAPIVRDAGRAFYVVGSTGRHATMQAGSLRVEQQGDQYTVIRTDGEYRTDDGARVAAGVVYFHFYAGLPQVRISHKLIVTENTNELWFRDIGVDLPLASAATHAATAGIDPVQLDGGKSLSIVQDEYPHFGSTASHFAIKAGDHELDSGPEAPDWIGLFSKEAGLAAQLPGFAQLFPKAFIATPTQLTVKFWASEAGKELDFRTERIIADYFGHDWIPADHKVTQSPNNAQGTGRTHDLWLYPLQGKLTGEMTRQFAAHRDAVTAMTDPAYIASTNLMGPWHPKDTKRFPLVEEVIDDYFTRAIFVSQKVFPPNGYLYDGCYPYVAQGWEFRNGRWYPQVHRLSRCLEYNLKRSVWVLAARSADPRYYDYARRYTRFMHDIGFANCEIEGRPYRGRLFQQGVFDSPIVWAGRGAYITYASSEDVIQFVYDYFLSGDFHSRDMALHWKQAMIDEFQWDVDKALSLFPAVILLRPLGSIYELDHDPHVYAYGHAMLERMTLTQEADDYRVMNEEVRLNHGKMGESYMAYYYYHVSTGDELAKRILVRLAEFCYRFGRVDSFTGRDTKTSLEAFAYKWSESKDPRYAAWLTQWLRKLGRDTVTLKRRGLDPEQFHQLSTEDWEQPVMTGQDAFAIGAPVVMRAVLDYDGPTPELPHAFKSFPTQKTWLLLHKETSGPAEIEVFINNVGDPQVSPRLTDSSGRDVPLEVVEHVQHREPGPQWREGYHWMYSIWYMEYEGQHYLRLRIPASAAPGLYRLDLGDEVAFTVLHSDIDRIMLEAPDGMVVMRHVPVYFNVPAGLEAVELFAHRAPVVLDPDGNEVALEDLGHGQRRFSTDGRAGVYALTTTGDQALGSTGTVDTFFRLHNVPMITAVGDKSRLLPLDKLPKPLPGLDRASLPAVDPEAPFVEGRFGQAAALFQRFIELPLDTTAGFPLEQGTVEFWVRPLWSATDFEFSNSTQRWQLFAMDPIQIMGLVDPDNSGRTGRFSLSRLDAFFAKNGAQTRAWWYPVAGKWQHVALTWSFDGKASFAHLYINGRQRAYYHYDAGVPTNLTTEKLIPPDTLLRFGSAHLYGRGATGEIYDELRVSRVVRYTGDFVPTDRPFEPDDDTFVLMHLDGTLEATHNGQAKDATLVAGGRMK